MNCRLLSLALAASLALPAFLAESAQAESIGKVENVEIKAFGTPPAATKQELQAEQGVVRDELLETVEGGGVTIAFIDGTSFYLGSASQAKLDQFLFNPQGGDGSIVGLGVGAFRFISGNETEEGAEEPKPKFATTTSIIGIRGTDFIVRHEPSGLTRVGVVSGIIDVTSRETGETVEVLPGQYAVLDTGGGSIPVRSAPVRPGDLACWLTRDAYICGVSGPGAGSSSAGPSGGTASQGSTSGGTGPGTGPGAGPGDPGAGPGDPGGGPGDPGGGNGGGGGGESAS